MFVYLRTIPILFQQMIKKEFTNEQEYLARIAKALSHPIRITILQLLATKECCYHGNLSEVIPVAKSTLSQHLKELKDAGLIEGTIESPNVKYCIDQERWKIAKTKFAYFFNNIKQNSESC